jgi:hypothetical protein
MVKVFVHKIIYRSQLMHCLRKEKEEEGEEYV